MNTVDEIKRLIKVDVKAGIIPQTVKSYSELHDYVDANEYLGELDYPISEDDRDNEIALSEWTDKANARMDIVNDWIASGSMVTELNQ